MSQIFETNILKTRYGNSRRVSFSGLQALMVTCTRQCQVKEFTLACNSISRSSLHFCKLTCCPIKYVLYSPCSWNIFPDLASLLYIYLSPSTEPGWGFRPHNPVNHIINSFSVVLLIMCLDHNLDTIFSRSSLCRQNTSIHQGLNYLIRCIRPVMFLVIPHFNIILHTVYCILEICCF